MLIAAQKPLRYVVAFLIIFLTLYGVYYWAKPSLPIYYAVLADSVCWFLSLFDSSVACQANFIIYSGTKELVIVEGCDGVTFVVLILAAVFPFPAPWKHKLYGLAWLIPGLLALNWLRLMVLSLIRFHFPQGFDFAHVYLFQPIMIVVTLMLFLLWTASADEQIPKG